REVADHLRAVVFAEQEVVFGQVFNDGAGFVAHIGKQVNHLDSGGESGRVLRLAAQCTHGRYEPEGGKNATPRDVSIESHVMCERCAGHLAGFFQTSRLSWRYRSSGDD